MGMTLDRIPADDFEALLGQSLQVRADAQALEMTVDGVERSPFPTARPIPGFSVVLRSARQPPLGQGIVVLTHPRHGELELFMTPIGRDAQGIRYEIVFN